MVSMDEVAEAAGLNSFRFCPEIINNPYFHAEAGKFLFSCAAWVRYPRNGRTAMFGNVAATVSGSHISIRRKYVSKRVHEKGGKG